MAAVTGDFWTVTLDSGEENRRCVPVVAPTTVDHVLRNDSA